jgi:hypothetical protein
LNNGREGERVDKEIKDHTQRELQKLLDQFKEWDASTRKEAETSNLVAAPLHHYCDMLSLVGIVQRQQLWLTSIFHLNDPSEVRHGQLMAMQHMGTRIEHAARGGAVYDFCWEMVESFNKHFAGTFGLFVGSFSKTPDDLGQWRSYADDGRGVAIEVSPDWFKPDPAADVRTADVRDIYMVSNVVYDADEAAKRQKDAIDRALHILEQAEKRSLFADASIRDDFFRRLRVALATPLLFSSLTTKHPAWKHEAETRLIMINDKQKLANVIETRTRGSQIVSYIPITFPLQKPGILKNVWIGPAAIGEAEIGIENLLRANNIDPTDRIRRSVVPYRPR